MGLSDDQRAMLRLLAQRGEQGYEDIAALKGLSLDEARAQVAQALAQLDDDGALSGEPPAAAAEPPEEPATPAKEPAAAPVEPKPEPAAKAAPRRAAKPRLGGLPKPKLPSGGGTRAAIAAGIAVIALIAVILVVNGGDGGETGTGTPAASEAGAGGNEPENTASNPSKRGEVTKAVLKAVDGSGARGVAIFGKVQHGKKEGLALELAAEGLEATGKHSAYTLWLSRSPQRMLPLVSTEVGADGQIAGQFEVPTEVLAYLADETFKDLVVTRTDNGTLEAALAKATKEKKAPEYTGEEVLRGTVTGPVVGAQVRQEEAEKSE